MVHSFRTAVADARRHGDLYFAALLSEDHIQKAFGTARWLWHGWIYTPAVTVWVFLSQCLSADHSCREAVARLIAWRVARGLKPCSAETGAYCTARNDLPEEAVHSLLRTTGRQVEEESPESWRWHGRKVRVVDGSTVTMPDTPANQAAYPQQKSQAPGCGFPIARILVIFSLAAGTVLEAMIGKYKGKQTGENSLFRALHDALAEGDVVLADRYFSGWCDLALLAQRGVDLVVRKHQLRRTDFRMGKRLGKAVHLVVWPRPFRPAAPLLTSPIPLTYIEPCGESSFLSLTRGGGLPGAGTRGDRDRGGIFRAAFPIPKGTVISREGLTRPASDANHPAPRTSQPKGTANDLHRL